MWCSDKNIPKYYTHKRVKSVPTAKARSTHKCGTRRQPLIFSKRDQVSPRHVYIVCYVCECGTTYVYVQLLYMSMPGTGSICLRVSQGYPLKQGVRFTFVCTSSPDYSKVILSCPQLIGFAQFLTV